MEKLITQLKQALDTEWLDFTKLTAHSEYIWQPNYPTAIVHHKSRIKEPETLELFKSHHLLNEEGYTPHTLENETVDTLRFEAQTYIKTVDLLCLAGNKHTSYHFQEKRKADFWKKLAPHEDFIASVNLAHFGKRVKPPRIEKSLRDTLRQSKEVPTIATIGFIYIVNSTNDIKPLLSHYFPNTVEHQEYEDYTISIAWSPTLKEVNMSTFFYDNVYT